MNHVHGVADPARRERPDRLGARTAHGVGSGHGSAALGEASEDVAGATRLLGTVGKQFDRLPFPDGGIGERITDAADRFDRVGDRLAEVAEQLRELGDAVDKAGKGLARTADRLDAGGKALGRFAD